MKLSVPERHQLAIARKTLTYSDIAVKALGGMTKEQAKEIINKTRPTINEILGCAGIDAGCLRCLDRRSCPLFKAYFTGENEK